jgi:hypothetical protein
MQNVLAIASISIESIVGLICLLMAYKTITSRTFLPFHKQASGVSWDNVTPQLQLVILTILKISGLGFLVVGLLLLIFPLAGYLLTDTFIRYEVPAVGLIFSMGLYLFNFKLYQKTNADTPWKASLVSAVMLLAGIVLSGVSDMFSLS